MRVTRISGPFVSSMTGIEFETLRTMRMISAAFSSEACAELIRTMFIPALNRLRTNSSVQRCTESVATIFVRLIIIID
mgnify:FL=1